MSTREEIKSEMMLKVEKLIDQALESGKKPLTLTQIEELALEIGGEIEQAITHRLLEQQSTESNPPIPVCPSCGKRMHRKGKKSRYLRTRSGETELERAYFYCESCREGLFPPR